MRRCEATTSSSSLDVCVREEKGVTQKMAVDREGEGDRRWVQTEGDRERGKEDY